MKRTKKISESFYFGLGTEPMGGLAFSNWIPIFTSIPRCLKWLARLVTRISKSIQPIIDHSGIRQKVEAEGDDFLHLLIADKHQHDYLGVMYDYDFDPRFRQGCAVFWRPIKSLARSKDHFRALLLRTILHEIGHCLNLDHIYGGTVMTQTNQLGGGS